MGALAVSPLVGLVPAPPARADCDTQLVHLQRVDDARGTMFLGRLDHLSFQPSGDSYTFGIRRVYAGDVPSVLRIASGGCHPISGLERGARYLISAADPFAPT